MYPSKDKKPGEKAKRPQVGVKVSDELMIESLKKYNGNVSRAADAVGISRYTFYSRLKTSEALQQTHSDCRQRWIDELEDSTWDQAASSNDTQLKIFLLKTQAKDRGYILEDDKKASQDIAKAAFDYIVNRSKNPAEI